MFELGNKMAPVLQLGEELVTPPPKAASLSNKESKENYVVGSGSDNSSEVSERDRKKSYFDKTTPLL